MLSHMQHNFAEALLDPERDIPDSLTAQTGYRPTKRFSIYRNNVVVGLIEALRVRFPVAQMIVGEEFFAAMAKLFVTSRPPRSPQLMFYGDELPGFIEAFEPASDVPYLADVVRLEAARTHAYHAADRAPLASEALQMMDGAALWQCRVELHPSTHVLRSPHPVVTIWAMNVGYASLRPLTDEENEDALIVRPHFEVNVRRLPPGGAAFLEHLKLGAKLGDAAQAAAEQDLRFDLTANLAGMIQSQVIAAISVPAAAMAE